MGIISLIATNILVDFFREYGRTNALNPIYEDARFLISRLSREIRENAIDYDEYYNQRVVIPTLEAGGGQDFGINIAQEPWRHGYGQNYGRYYSSFFNPGTDNALGFACNDNVLHRNDRNCIPLRKTIDRNTGANPFSGKYAGASADKENAFCGNISYQAKPQLNARPQSQTGDCAGNGDPNNANWPAQDELYLISPDGTQKTIFARERVGGTDENPVYALSILRMKGVDIDRDKIPDRFVCAENFQCVGEPNVPVAGNDAAREICGQDSFGDLPRSREQELENGNDACDTAEWAFDKDFIPITPLTVNIKDLKFIISPAEDPRSAFAENEQQLQPNVTISLTVEPNPRKLGYQAGFQPITITQRVYSEILEPMPAPLLAQ